MSEVITDFNGKPADPRDCNYRYGWWRRDDVLVQSRTCLTHGHGEVVGETRESK